MGIFFTHKGDLKKTEKFLKKSMGHDWLDVLEKYAIKGVQHLSAATPVDSGETANSWEYEVIQNEDGYSISWNNTHIEGGWANIAILLQYGHGTRNGGYVVGRDYINPALRPIFDEMANAAWKEVTK